MRLVVIESPYASPLNGGVAANIHYARRCLRDCLRRGEAPLASHLLYTQDDVLDDSKPEERAIGIRAGHAWYVAAKACIVYVDQGISNGMRAGVAAAKGAGVVVEFRSLHGDREKVTAAMGEFSW